MPIRRAPRKNIRRRRNPRASERKIRQVVKSELKKEIESKFYDYSVSSTISTALTAINPLTSFARGTGPSNYIGMKVKPVFLTIRGTLTGSDATNFVRMVVIQDKSVSGTPNVSTIFQNTTYPWISPFNVDYIDAYNVLADRFIQFRTFESAAGTFSGTTKYFKIKIPGKKLRQITYTNAGAADTGTLWILFISDSSLVSHPSYTFTSRFTYSDA